MRRFVRLSTISALTVLTLVVVAQMHAAAHNDIPTAAGSHPFVGAWIVDTDTADDANFPALAVATSDGTYLESHPDVGVRVGSWEATGERTVSLTIVFRAHSETGTPVGLVTAHATVEVTEDGDVWEAPYRFEAVAPDGSVLFAGEGHSRAVRVGADSAAVVTTPRGPLPPPKLSIGNRNVALAELGSAPPHQPKRYVPGSKAWSSRTGSGYPNVG